MILEQDAYGLIQVEKEALLLPELNQLTAYHQEHCPEYARLFPSNTASKVKGAETLEQVPFITVPLFKQLALKSIPDDAIFKALTSSGTTGQVPSRIFLDADTAKLQSKILVKIMQEWLGKKRRAMLIWDHPGVIQNRDSFSARGAGIQGLSFLGHHHTYAYHEDMSLNLEALRDFFERYHNEPILMFGFTFMVWKYGLKALQEAGIQFQCSDAVLIHSGGWKKLEHEAVSIEHFNKTAQTVLGQGTQVHNFYGMVEQVGSIFVACEQGHLHCPNYADVLVREPGSWRALEVGENGILQVLSALPKSYPGHSLLTEDEGTILGVDDCACGRPGKYFQIKGRMAKVEARGCSDTFEAKPDKEHGA